jgi:heat shock protein HslJ
MNSTFRSCMYIYTTVVVTSFLAESTAQARAMVKEEHEQSADSALRRELVNGAHRTRHIEIAHARTT